MPDALQILQQERSQNKPGAGTPRKECKLATTTQEEHRAHLFTFFILLPNCEGGVDRCEQGAHLIVTVLSFARITPRGSRRRGGKGTLNGALLRHNHGLSRSIPGVTHGGRRSSFPLQRLWGGAWPCAVHFHLPSS